MRSKKPDDPSVDQHGPDLKGLSRRGFLTTAGVSAVGAATLARRTGAAEPEPARRVPSDEGGLANVPVTLEVNGRRHRLLVEPRWSLLFVLRERLGLTGTKVGCERGECGSCTVLLDDVPRYACLTLAVEAEGRAITTVEGLLDGESLGEVQQAFREHDAYQCGYCTPGQIVAVEGMLRENPDPTLDDVRTGVSGNLCRCGAYPNIFRAALDAAGKRRDGRKRS